MINLVVLNEYAGLQAQLKAVKARMDAIKPEVIKQLEATGPLAADGFELRLKQRKKWTYPDNVIEAEQRYKTEKLTAEASGAATFTETPYVECKLSDG